MDPSAVIPLANIPVLHPVVGGLTPLVAVVGVSAGAVVALVGGVSVSSVLSNNRRRALWRRVGQDLGLRPETGATSVALTTPILRGILHGRAVEATLLPSGLAQIAVRIANPRHLLDQIPTSDPAALASAAWLTADQRQELAALTDRRRLGSIAVRGSFVTLTAPFVADATGDPAPLRSLFHLAHAIAECVDSTSAPQPVARPTPPRAHRRLGPGTVFQMSQIRHHRA